MPGRRNYGKLSGNRCLQDRSSHTNNDRFSIKALYYFSLAIFQLFFCIDKFIDVYHSKTSFVIEFGQSLYFLLALIYFPFHRFLLFGFFFVTFDCALLESCKRTLLSYFTQFSLSYINVLILRVYWMELDLASLQSVRWITQLFLS